MTPVCYTKYHNSGQLNSATKGLIALVPGFVIGDDAGDGLAVDEELDAVGLATHHQVKVRGHVVNLGSSLSNFPSSLLMIT